MLIAPSPTCTAFDSTRRIAAGTLAEVVLAVKKSLDAGAEGPVLIYDDQTGRVLDIDTRGTQAQVLERAADPESGQALAGDTQQGQLPAIRGRGRPRLGVVAREVTLLPRHWEWLARQPGGASVALRKLVETARRDHDGQERRRQAQEAAYRFMSAMAGDLPGFEEAARALFADDRPHLLQLMQPWPRDVADYALKLAGAVEPGAGTRAHSDVHGTAAHGPHLRSL